MFGRTGEKNPMFGRVREDKPGAKLTQEQADQIRQLYATGDYFQRELGAQFNVSQVAVSLILRGKTWPTAGQQERNS